MVGVTRGSSTPAWMYVWTREVTIESLYPGRTATRAPSRAALVTICHVWNARPHSMMPIEISRSSGSVNAISISAVPRWSRRSRIQPNLMAPILSLGERRDDDADGDRRRIREAVVPLRTLDVIDARPRRSHQCGCSRHGGGN